LCCFFVSWDLCEEVVFLVCGGVVGGGGGVGGGCWKAIGSQLGEREYA